MVAPSPMDPAPNPWKVIDDYGKTVITLASALLALTITFLGQFAIDEASHFQVILLIATWACLILAILFGLLGAAKLSNYLRGRTEHIQSVALSNLSFFSLLLASIAFGWFAVIQVLWPPPKYEPKAIIQRALDFMPSYYRISNPTWSVQSMTFDPAKKSYDFIIHEDTTKAQFSITVPLKGKSIDAKRIP